MSTQREGVQNSGAVRSAWFLFLATVLLVALGSAVVLVQRLSRPLEETTGTMLQLDERRPGLNRTVYGLTLESEAGEQLYLRLRNRGRVLPYLQEAGTEGTFTIEHRGGLVLALTDEAEAVTIEEREAPLALYGVTLALAVAVLLLFGNALRDGRLLGAAPEAAAAEEVASVLAYEEEE